MNPTTLAASRWLEMVDGVIFAPQLPTCHDNVYDYFVVHKSLAIAVVGVLRVLDGFLSPHWVSRLLIRGDARRFAIRSLQRPAPVRGSLPFGPPNKPPDYCEVGTSVAGGDLQQATVQWLTAARGEWSDLTSADLAFAEHRFKWTTAIIKKASPWQSASDVSALWRALAGRVGCIMSVAHTEPANSSRRKAVSDHIGALV